MISYSADKKYDEEFTNVVFDMTTNLQALALGVITLQ